MTGTQLDLDILHQRLLNGDQDAWAEIAAELFPDLLAALDGRYPKVRDKDLLSDGVTQALQRYRKRPHDFGPGKEALFADLLRVAAGNLANCLHRAHRRQCHESAAPEGILRFFVENDSRRDMLIVEGPRPEERLKELLECLDDFDRRFADLMLERKPLAVLAASLGVAHLSLAEQTHEVKKARDRIVKKLMRVARKHKNSRKSTSNSL